MKKTAGKETPSKVTTAKEAIKEVPKDKPKPKAPSEEASAPASKARMGKPELKFFENLLNEKKETLIQELGYLEDNTMRLNSKEGAGDLSSHAYHLADHATETQDREQAFHMASREGKYLFYIEEALDRVRAGTFGVCKKCGKLIPKARLEAVPTAKMCIECKTKQERAAEAASAG
jgi:DnaK suppressor protein